MRFHRPRPLSTRPRVSVVVPCYNYGHYLAACVASALDQPGVDVDVLIVDDASPDGSAEVAHHLAALDPRIGVLVHETNRGHIQTYNDGLERASGEYVVLLSADDLLTPGALSRAASLMEHHPQVGFVYGYAQSFTERPPADNRRERSWSVWSGHEWLAISARRGRCFISSPEVVMRSAALHEAKGYDPRLPHSGDFDMWMRTAVSWDVGRVNGSAQAWYRVHDANMHLTTFQGWLTDLEARSQTFDILFDERAPEDVAVQRLRPAAQHALASEAVRRALASHREGLEPGVIESYLAFAERTWPPVVRTLGYRLCQAGPVSGRTLPGGRLTRFGARARHHFEWRRERRYGV